MNKTNFYSVQIKDIYFVMRKNELDNLKDFPKVGYSLDEASRIVACLYKGLNPPSIVSFESLLERLRENS